MPPACSRDLAGHQSINLFSLVSIDPMDVYQRGFCLIPPLVPLKRFYQVKASTSLLRKWILLGTSLWICRNSSFIPMGFQAWSWPWIWHVKICNYKSICWLSRPTCKTCWIPPPPSRFHQVKFTRKLCQFQFGGLKLVALLTNFCLEWLQ